MKLSHYRSPSDPGPPNIASGHDAKTSSYDAAEKQFLIWLHAVSVRYLSLTDPQRIRTIDNLLSLCGAKELLYLCDVLPNLLYRDFLRLLPAELSINILMMLDERSLLNCCLVSKHWYQLIHSFREVWIHMSQRMGARVSLDPAVPLTSYKALFMRSTQLVSKMRDRSAFDVKTMEGHKGRVMAIWYNGDKVATGSDDHTVRFWDIVTGQCLKVIHTHSVSALKFDDQFVFTASYDNTAACWDIDTGQLVCRYVGHISAVFSLDVRRGLNLLVTGSADKTVKLWQLSTGIMLNSLSEWHLDWVTHIRILSFKFHKDAPEDIGVADADVLERGTLKLVSVDRQGCYFWSITNNDRVDVSVNHTADWCMFMPSDFALETVSVCTWSQRFHVQCVETFSTEVDENDTSVARHISSTILPKVLPAKQTVLGIGRKFAVFMVDEGYSRIVILDLQASRILCSVTTPPFRPSQNGGTVTLGSFDWLDGFTDTNKCGLFLALCLKDNNILTLHWHDEPG